MEEKNSYEEYIGAFDEGDIVSKEDLITEEELENGKEIL